MDSGTRRVVDTWLLDDNGVVHSGDFLLHRNGSFSPSIGDVDVVEVVDGST